jgi:predicted Fe-Mo cluster-binding NifX family protein
MGMKAQEIFAANGIKVIYGVENKPLQMIVECYINGDLTSGSNLCDH